MKPDNHIKKNMTKQDKILGDDVCPSCGAPRNPEPECKHTKRKATAFQKFISKSMDDMKKDPIYGIPGQK